MKIPRSMLLTCALACAWVASLPAQPPGSPPGGTPGGFPGGFPGSGGGFPGFQPPQPGQVLPTFLQDQLKLTAEQKKQLAKFQKDVVDAELKKILTTEQQKSLNDMRSTKGGFGPPKGFGAPGGFGPGKGFGPPGGGGFGFGTAGNDDVKKKIGATDEEWKVIGPKVQKVSAARRVLGTDSSFGKGMGSNIVSQAQAELKTVLDNPKHSKSEVDEKIAALRKVRQQAKADLEAAQRDLAQMLTPAQEAVMMSLGYLE